MVNEPFNGPQTIQRRFRNRSFNHMPPEYGTENRSTIRRTHQQRVQIISHTMVTLYCPFHHLLFHASLGSSSFTSRQRVLHSAIQTILLFALRETSPRYHAEPCHAVHASRHVSILRAQPRSSPARSRRRRRMPAPSSPGFVQLTRHTDRSRFFTRHYARRDCHHLYHYHMPVCSVHFASLSVFAHAVCGTARHAQIVCSPTFILRFPPHSLYYATDISEPSLRYHILRIHQITLLPFRCHMPV